MHSAQQVDLQPHPKKQRRLLDRLLQQGDGARERLDVKSEEGEGDGGVAEEPGYLQRDAAREHAQLSGAHRAGQRLREGGAARTTALLHYRTPPHQERNRGLLRFESGLAGILEPGLPSSGQGAAQGGQRKQKPRGSGVGQGQAAHLPPHPHRAQPQPQPAPPALQSHRRRPPQTLQQPQPGPIRAPLHLRNLARQPHPLHHQRRPQSRSPLLDHGPRVVVVQIHVLRGFCAGELHAGVHPYCAAAGGVGYQPQRHL